MVIATILQAALHDVKIASAGVGSEFATRLDVGDNVVGTRRPVDGDRDLFSQVIGYVNNQSLATRLPAAIEHGGLDEYSGLIVQQILPPVRSHEFRQHNNRKLAIIVLCICALQEIK